MKKHTTKIFLTFTDVGHLVRVCACVEGDFRCGGVHCKTLPFRLTIFVEFHTKNIRRGNSLKCSYSNTEALAVCAIVSRCRAIMASLIE